MVTPSQFISSTMLKCCIKENDICLNLKKDRKLLYILFFVGSSSLYFVVLFVKTTINLVSV